MAYDVFISYSSADKHVADAVCATLETRNIRCWIAPRDIEPGKEWSESIIDGLNQCRVMILLLSSHANLSPQVRREAERAVHKQLTIIPFRIEDVPLSKSMEYFISATHWLDALSPPMDQHLVALATYVQRMLPDRQPRPQPSVTQPAVAPPAVSPPVPDETPRAGLQCDGVTLKNIETELATFIGPLARLLVRQTVEAATSRQDLCQRLALHIGNANERASFLQRCQELSPAPPTTIATEAAAPTTVIWDPATLNRAEKRLANYVGPIAKHLVKKTARRATSVEELYHSLVEYVPTEKERAEFLEVGLA